MCSAKRKSASAEGGKVGAAEVLAFFARLLTNRGKPGAPSPGGATSSVAGHIAFRRASDNLRNQRLCTEAGNHTILACDEYPRECAL